MKRFLAILLLVSSVAALFPPIQAQRKRDKAASASASLAAQRGLDRITAEQMQSYLSFIASDEMEGRDTPSRGLDTTAKFLAMNLQRWGFKPAGDNGTFLQRIDLRRDRIDGGQSKVDYNGRVLTTGSDYLPVGGSGNVSGGLVFAGNGWFIKTKRNERY